MENRIMVLLLGVLMFVANIDCNDYIFETTNLDSVVMPTLANGHVGFTLFGDSLLINGLYNGYLGYSHRARIPNHSNLQLELCAYPSVTPTTNCVFRMLADKGMFEVVYTSPDGSYTVTQHIFAHRFYNRIVINQFTVTRLSGSAVITIRLTRDAGASSVDITFSNPIIEVISGSAFNYIHGTTNEVEDEKYQKEKRPVSVYYQGAPQIILGTDQSEQMFQFITSIDNEDSVARQEIEDVVNSTPILVRDKHIAEWGALWQRFGITIRGDDNLAQVVTASLYYLTSSLPSVNTNQPKNDFYGLSPSGLGKGGVKLTDYQGHSFWDTEIWMQPSILLMYPEWSKDLLHYRYITSEASRDHAHNTGYKGIRYVWESAYTGRETTPPCCPEVVMYQHHITADVTYALRNHLYSTFDLDWFKKEGCAIAYETAKYWESRVVYNETTEFYDIKGVMGPDEDHHNVDNNVYTNIIAGYNLHFGEFASCLCHNTLDVEEIEVVTHWSKIAESIKLLYNNEEKYHPQFEGYEIGTPIKQADVVLVGYPLLYPIDIEAKRNNLRIYSEVTRENGPAMTWAMHTIGHLDINDTENADVNFLRSYSNYVRKPFMVWSESIEDSVSAGNFITGAGGFLQSIYYGYAGIKLHQKFLQISNGRLPANVTNLFINGFTYLGTVFSIQIEAPATRILKIVSLNKDIPIVITAEGQSTDGCENCEYNYVGSPITITAETFPYGDCPVPSKMIGVNKNNGNRLLYSKILLISLIAIFFNIY